MGTEEVADCVRDALSPAAAIREVKMFGGIGFMLNGNMVAAVSKRGLLLRVGKERQPLALRRPAARVMEMGGRKMEGYVHVDPKNLTANDITEWVQLASAFVRTLPRKDQDKKPPRKKGKRK
jgi:TfoX/Sxy family transcriptional regulator of competence genes